MPSWLPENNTPLPQDPIERSLKKINDLLLISGGGGGPHTHDAADIVSGTLATVRLGSGVADATTFLRGDQTWAVPASGGAPVGAQYLVLATDVTLTAERVLTGTANQIVLTDAGAGSTLTLSLPQSIATTSTPQFLRLGLGVAADATASILATGQIVGPLGTVTAPAFSFTGDTTTGWYRRSASVVTLAISGANAVDIGVISNLGIRLRSGDAYRWSSSATDAASTTDLSLFRDAAATLALRNGTTAQRLRIYNTFTTVETSGEWFAIDWAATANVCNMWTKKGSSAGTARNLGLGTDGTQRWSIHATTGLLAAAAGVDFQLGNAAVAETPPATHTVQIKDSTGTTYRVLCLV